MAITLTTNEGAIIAHVNGKFDRTIPKGSFSIVNNNNGYIILDHPSQYSALKLDVDTTLDGASFADLEELADALSAFSRGGGAPGEGVQSVTGDLVDNTDPDNPVIITPTSNQIEHNGVFSPGGGTGIGSIDVFVNANSNAINALYMTGDTLMQIEAMIPSPTGLTPYSGSLHDYLTALSGEIQGIFSRLSDLEDGGTV